METPGNVVIVLYKKGSNYKILLSRTFCFLQFWTVLQLWHFLHVDALTPIRLSWKNHVNIVWVCFMFFVCYFVPLETRVQAQTATATGGCIYTHTGLNNKTPMRFWMRLRNVLQWFIWLCYDLAFTKCPLWIKWHFKCTFFFFFFLMYQGLCLLSCVKAAKCWLCQCYSNVTGIK